MNLKHWLTEHGVDTHGKSVQHVFFVRGERPAGDPKEIKNDAWAIDEKRTGDQTYFLYLKDEGDNWYKASVKWDGCIEIEQAANTPFEEGRTPDDCDDNTHICNLDAYIDRLQKLKELAKKFFGEDWK